MSTMSFNTGSKTENGVYLAFGVVIGLVAIRLWAPETFLNPTDAIVASIFWGSLLGSLAFLLKLDRFVTWWIKVLTLRKYREVLENHLIRIDIALSIWEVFVTETWETPKDKSNEKLSRLMDGPILHNDIWSMKGAFYFGISLPFLFFAAGFTTLVSLSLILILWIVIGFLVWYNHKGFLFRCVQLASYLSMKETRSVVQLRKKHKSETHSSSAYDPFTSEIVDTVLDELEIMTNHRDWRGFERRMDYFLETLEQEVNFQQNSLSSDYVKIWTGVISGYNETSRQRSLIQTKVMKKILTYATELSCIDTTTSGLSILLSVSNSDLSDAEVIFRSVDDSGMRDSYLEPLYSAFYKQSSPPVNMKIVEIVLKWYKDGYTNFAEHLLSSIEYVEEELRKRVVHALLGHKGENIWNKAKVRAVKSLLTMKSSSVEKTILLALRGGQKAVVSEILKNADTEYYDLVKEVTNYITNEDSSLALIAVDFFMRIDKDLMLKSFLPALFKENELKYRMNAMKFLGRLWNIDDSLLIDDWKVKRDTYRRFLSIALEDDKPGVRSISVDILKTLKPTRPEAESLEIIASDDPVDDIRFAAKKILKRK